jgi:dihydroorotase/N-acyl-D-amino-acid deacylase
MRKLSLLLLLALLNSCVYNERYDYIIDDVRIIDGTGSPWFIGDVAIKGDRIAKVDRHIDTDKARYVIKAEGLYLAPGFIDIHSHARRGLKRHPIMENIIRQGVTTVIEGNDGSSPLPLGKYMREIEKLDLGANIGFFVGHGTIRDSIIGWENRKPTPEELERMKELVEQAMKDGAFGISTGLIYPPGTFADTEEIIELAKVVARYGGIYITHMRDEASKVLNSIEETIRIGREAKIPVQVTHHKVVGKINWGLSTKTLSLIQRAREVDGVDITIDQYPYTATQTGIYVLVPNWAKVGGIDSLKRRLIDTKMREKIKEGIIQNIIGDRGGGDPSNIQIARCRWNTEYEGLTLADILERRGIEPNPENAAELVIEIIQNGGASAVYHCLSEEDVKQIMRFPWTMHASDGGVYKPGWGHPHPRSYGTFPRVLSRYVRKLGVLQLEEAIRKMTSLPAWRLGLLDRGLIRPGFVADLVIFDYERIQDKATFKQPHQYADGILYLWVNGVLTIENGKLTGKTGGKVLRSSKY